MVPSATASTAAAPTSGVLTQFGYNTVASGVTLVTQGTDNSGLRTTLGALVFQDCTRVANAPEKVRYSTASTAGTPIDQYVHISAITSRSRTYKVPFAGRWKYGSTSSSTIGDIALGGANANDPNDPSALLPKLVIKGLTVTSDAFHTAKGYGTAPKLKLGQISLNLGKALDQFPLPVQDLQHAIDGVLNTAQPVVDQVVSVLQKYGTIKIPGFGTIALGETWNQQGATFAASEIHGLVIRFIGDGNDTHIYLGSARSRIGGIAKQLVFRTNMDALNLKALNAPDPSTGQPSPLVSLGRVGAKSMPCEGTFGETRFRQVKTAGVLAPVVLNITGVTQTYNGTQHLGNATGWVQSSVSSVDIPVAQISLKGLVSRIKVTKVEGRRVVSKVTTSLGELSIGGKVVKVPAPGTVLNLPNNLGTLQVGVVKYNSVGARAYAVLIKLFQDNAVIALGRTDAQIWPN